MSLHFQLAMCCWLFVVVTDTFTNLNIQNINHLKSKPKLQPCHLACSLNGALSFWPSTILRAPGSTQPAQCTTTPAPHCQIQLFLSVLPLVALQALPTIWNWLVSKKALGECENEKRTATVEESARHCRSLLCAFMTPEKGVCTTTPTDSLVSALLVTSVTIQHTVHSGVVRLLVIAANVTLPLYLLFGCTSQYSTPEYLKIPSTVYILTYLYHFIFSHCTLFRQLFSFH